MKKFLRICKTCARFLSCKKFSVEDDFCLEWTKDEKEAVNKRLKERK